MCPVVRFVMSDCQRDPRPRLSWWLTIGMSWVVRHISWLVVCRCGAQRQWSSRDMPCRWTWSGEGRTWGLDRGTRRPGDQPRWLTSRTSTSARLHRRDCVDQVKTMDVWVERGSGGLGGLAGRGWQWHVSSGGVSAWRTLLAGGSWVWASKPRWRFQGEMDDTWRQRLHRSKATSWRARWPSDVGFV